MERNNRLNFIKELKGFRNPVCMYNTKDFLEAIFSVGGNIISYRVYGEKGNYFITER